MPQLEEPTTKNTQLYTGGFWGEKGKNKIFKKKKKKERRREIDFKRDLKKLATTLHKQRDNMKRDQKI